MEIYLDNSATTKPYIEVVQEVQRCMLEFYGNPSSIHSSGENAKLYLKESRRTIAETLKAKEEEIVFTSGGSESNNLALKGWLKQGDHMITSNIEHSSILNCCLQLENLGVEVTYLKVDEQGRVNLEELRESFKPNTKLVSIMHVNNEIGVIQAVGEIGKLIKSIKREAVFHVDAVQSYGKLNIDVNKLNIDMLSISAHKIHGPRGIGALYIRESIKLEPLISGGGQEFNIRAGTENLPAIAGFAMAAVITNKRLEDNFLKVSMLKESLLEKLQVVEKIKINSNNSKFYIPHIVSISIVGIRSGKILFYLNDREVYISKSSACSSRKLSDSHVLKAINLKPEELKGSLRISFNADNTLDEVDRLVHHIKNCLIELNNKE
jgi:cysteine desulfurase